MCKLCDDHDYVPTQGQVVGELSGDLTIEWIDELRASATSAPTTDAQAAINETDDAVASAEGVGAKAEVELHVRCLESVVAWGDVVREERRAGALCRMMGGRPCDGCGMLIHPGG